MTENSDSGFTEINQTGSSDVSQHAKSETSSPEPDLRHESEIGESSTPALDNTLSNLGTMSKSSGSNSNSSSDDDDSDEDYEDSDGGGRPNVLNWVS
jgi:hypothetical protein